MNTRQQSLLESFLHHQDRHERLSAVVDRARRQPRFSSAERSPQNRVLGCSSSVWLIYDLHEGRCRFRSDAESSVVRGLVALLAEFFSELPPAEVLNSNADPLDELDLKRDLTPTRRHGLAAVSAAIRSFATSVAQPRTDSPSGDRSEHR